MRIWEIYYGSDRLHTQQTVSGDFESNVSLKWRRPRLNRWIRSQRGLGEKKKLNELIIHAAFDVEKDDLPASHVNGIDRGGTEFQPCVD